MKYFIQLNITLLSIISIFFCSCSTRPTLYPNEYYKSVGKEKSEKAIESVMAEADKTNYDSPNYGKSTAQAVGAVAIGAGTGAAAGAISGGVWVGAIKGAIVGFSGSIIYFIFGSFDHTQLYKNYVDTTLQKQGYEVIGWK